MSFAAKAELYQEDNTPLLIFLALFEARGWSCRSSTAEEVSGEVGASWGRYQLRFIRRSNDPVMQAVCLPDIRVPDAKVPHASRLLSLVNEQVWLGHFELWSCGNVLVYRHALLLGDGGSITLDQAQSVAEAAIEECDRFYPAFQFALWSDRSPEDALAAALVDAVGEA